jgi:hypothetical protein
MLEAHGRWIDQFQLQIEFGIKLWDSKQQLQKITLYSILPSSISGGKFAQQASLSSVSLSLPNRLVSAVFITKWIVKIQPEKKQLFFLISFANQN